MKVRVFSTKELIRANTIAKKEGFNRHFTKDNIDRFVRSRHRSLFWPIVFNFLHNHKKGKSCKPHMRCLIEAPNAETYQIDCDMELYNKLKVLTVEEARKLN